MDNRKRELSLSFLKYLNNNFKKLMLMVDQKNLLVLVLQLQKELLLVLGLQKQLQGLQEFQLLVLKGLMERLEK